MLQLLIMSLIAKPAILFVFAVFALDTIQTFGIQSQEGIFSIVIVVIGSLFIIRHPS